MDLYIASFYTLKPYQDTTALLNADEPMALSLHILSSLITSEKMEEATREGFINATGGNTAALQKEIEMFIAIFKEPISLNDRYDFLYLHSNGVLISKNGFLAVTFFDNFFSNVTWYFIIMIEFHRIRSTTLCL